MAYNAFWTLVGGAVALLAVWLVYRWTKRNDFELGAKAFQDGLRLNVGWSKEMQAGWVHAWRAQNGLNDLGEELRKIQRQLGGLDRKF